MAAFVEEIGVERNRVLVVDDFMTEPKALIDQASAMAPFKAERDNYYPGLRRFITSSDGEAGMHVERSLHALAPLMGQVFGIHAYQILRASFCLVTKRPEELGFWQRLPHIDQADPGYFALLHFLSPTPQGGTNFFRHRRTGFERISPDREPVYAEARKAELMANGPPPVRFFNDSDLDFERTARFEGKFNRLLIYRGSLLHSGYIPSDFPYSSDPQKGRLTCNIFIQAQLSSNAEKSNQPGSG